MLSPNVSTAFISDNLPSSSGRDQGASVGGKGEGVGVAHRALL